MKILFISNLNNKGGPIVWKEGLIKSLSSRSEINCREFKVSFFPQFREFIKGIKLIEESDIIHSFTESPSILIFFIICKIFRKPIVYTLHGNYFIQKKSKSGWKKKIWIPANDYCLLMASKITVPSKYLLNAVCKRRKFVCDKITVIRNGIDINTIINIRPYSKKELGLNEFVFLILEITSFNYLEKAKGVVPLIDAFKQFNDENPLSELWIIGDGKYFDYFKNEYSSKNTLFLGEKDRNEVLRLIKGSDLIVHSTFLDTFSYVVLEAMVCGKTIISTNTGGIPELVDMAGIIVNPKKGEIFKKINELYKNETIRDRFSKEAIDRSFLYDWELVSNEFINIYKNVRGLY